MLWSARRSPLRRGRWVSDLGLLGAHGSACWLLRVQRAMARELRQGAVSHTLGDRVTACMHLQALERGGEGGLYSRQTQRAALYLMALHPAASKRKCDVAPRAAQMQHDVQHHGYRGRLRVHRQAGGSTRQVGCWSVLGHVMGRNSAPYQSGWQDGERGHAKGSQPIVTRLLGSRMGSYVSAWLHTAA